MRAARGNSVWKMTMFARLAACLVAAFFAGCASKDAPRKEASKPPVEAASEPNAVREGRPADTVLPQKSKSTEAALSVDEASSADEKKLQQLKNGKIIAVSVLSSRSLSMKLRLEGGTPAVFKPFRKGDRRARYEVAAYKTARLLHVEKVPAAVMRRIPLSFLIGRLQKDDGEAAARLQNEVPKNADETVEGAMIEWMEDIDKNGLEALGGTAAISRLLGAETSDGDPPPLAAAASTMVVFDHLIGNWDRFSGGNFFVSKDARHLILIDHNGSFLRLSEKQRARMEKRLASTLRFSASLTERLRALTSDNVREAVDKEAEFGPLLKDAQIDLLLSRRDEILSHVDAVIKKNGLKSTLAFP
jgi:hypothetical protein